jgi:hypothetical protein
MRILLFFLFLLPSFAYAATPPPEIMLKWNGSKKHFEYACTDRRNYSLIAEMFGLEPHDLIAINTGTMQTLLDRGDKVLVPLNHKNYFTDSTLISANNVEPVWHGMDKETAIEELLQLFRLNKEQFAQWNAVQKDRYAATDKVIVGWVLYQPIAPLVLEEERLPVKEGSLDAKLAGSDIMRSSPKLTGTTGSKSKINPAIKTPIKPTASPKPTASAKPTAKVSESSAQESNALGKIRDGLQKVGKETGSFIQNLFGSASDTKTSKKKDTTEKVLSTREQWITQLRQRKDSIRRASAQASLTPSGATKDHSKRVVQPKEEEVLRSSRKGLLGGKRKETVPDELDTAGKASIEIVTAPSPTKAPPPPPMPRFPEQFKGRKAKKSSGGNAAQTVPDVLVENNLIKASKEATPLEIKTSEIKTSEETTKVTREPLTHNVRGKAGVFYAGASEGKIYVVTNLCARGSVVQITNTSNGRTILADVIGPLPTADSNKGLVLKVSDNCKSYLKLTQDSFPVQVDY